MYDNSNNNLSKEHALFLSKIRKRKRKILITQIGLLLIALALWEIAAQFKLIDTFLTSSPSAIWKLFIQYISEGQLIYHTGISVFETVVGFILGTFLGVIVAIGLWWSDFWAQVLDPYMVILNSLPKTALAPIFIIWVGAGYKGIIVTAITISIIVTIMNMYSSYRSIDEDKLRLLETFGATKLQILRKVIIPSSTPDLMSTLKINIGLSWVGVIVGEFLVSKAGLGYLIVYGMQVFRLDLVMMNVVILGAISVIMYKIIALIEKRFTKWQK